MLVVRTKLTAEEIMLEAKRVLNVEAEAIQSLQKNINADFVRAIELLFNCKGKIIVSGMGKSGQIARKISSTLSSTGSPSVYLHPAESSHGDLGIISHDDLVIAISYGGESSELSDLVSFTARKGIPLIGITGNSKSTLAKASTVLVNVNVPIEACPLGLAPTSSTTATLAMGDALAMSLLKLRGFKEADFAELHPGGKLGRKLITRVRDLMHTGKDLPLISENMPIREALPVMASGVRGVVGVTNSSGFLCGVLTDGDIRRQLTKGNPLDESVKNLMGKTPKTISEDELAEKALYKMEELSIQCLFVVESSSAGLKPLGIIHFQDILKAKIV